MGRENQTAPSLSHMTGGPSIGPHIFLHHRLKQDTKVGGTVVLYNTPQHRHTPKVDHAELCKKITALAMDTESTLLYIISIVCVATYTLEDMQITTLNPQR